MNLKLIELKSILNYLSFKEFKIFIETGSLFGDTIADIKNFGFDEIHSIELSEPHYQHCKNLFKNEKNIFLHLGDSSDVLKNLLPKLTAPSVFFLDAHYSSGDTAKGIKDVPLLEELETIKNFNYRSLLIIDDVRLFETNITEDWSQITENKIINILKDRIKYKTVNNDRLIILI